MSLVQEKGPAHKLMAACAAKLQQKDNIFEILFGHMLPSPRSAL